MAITKRISGDYRIINRDPVIGSGNVTITTNTLFVDGNLIIGGNSTQVTRTNTLIENNYITLNQGDAGPGITLGTAGIEINRSGGAANVALRYNDTLGVWQVSLGSAPNTFSNLATGSSGAIATIGQDTLPQLGGNLNISNYSIYSNVSGVQLYSVTQPGGGGTGITVTNSQYGNVELMSETKGIVYSIIFG